MARMEVTDQKHLSAQTHSSEIRTIKKQLKDYRSQHSTLERRVKGLERYVGFLKDELEDLDECMDMETVVDLIHEIVSSLVNGKCKGFSY